MATMRGSSARASPRRAAASTTRRRTAGPGSVHVARTATSQSRSMWGRLVLRAPMTYFGAQAAPYARGVERWPAAPDARDYVVMDDLFIPLWPPAWVEDHTL